MNILLTGSTGFIGSFYKQQYKNKHNIKTFSFLRDDIKKLELDRIDVIIHLAALVHQMDGAAKEEYYKVNVENTINLAKKAKQNGVGQFVFMSTVKVYGEETDTPYTETTKCNPQDEYGRSKLEAEIELQKLQDDNFIISIIRTPIVYGKGVKANILSLVKLIDKVSILPFGNISNKRSMVYIGNLCEMVDMICTKQMNGIFLAGDDDAVSTTQLIEIIARAKGKKVILFRFPLLALLLRMVKPSFYKRLYKSLEIDNRITKKRLGFNNSVSIEDGIKYMLTP